LNRAGVPLLEIVSEPDLRSSQEAYYYLTEIRKLVRYLDICDGNMEEGSMRCDANISVRKKGAPEFGTRCEVKNMNSIRNVQRAIEHEMTRQIDIIEAGGVINQETRSFNAADGTTSLLRSKEDAQDYRYFPEPDLPPVVITDDHIQRIHSTMPPLPKELLHKYLKEFNLSEYDANVLTSEKETALYYERIISKTKNYKAACNWLMGPVKGYLKEQALEIEQSPFTPEQLASIINLVDSGKVSSSTAAEKILPALANHSSKMAEDVAAELNLIQDADDDSIKQIAQEILAAWPDKVAAYKAGNKGMLGLFMGELMKKSGGKANPKTASGLIQQLLDQ
jgi:aspartyl-tRNA(Asn)/glutamyl-tRNA(Gln) amidotransferase subunit B